jgi:hypothetical protein
MSGHGCRIELFAAPPCPHMAAGGSPAGLRASMFGSRLELYCKVEGCPASIFLGDFQISFSPDVASTDEDIDGKPTLTLVP